MNLDITSPNIMFAVTPYFVSIPLIWGAIVRIVLPKRLREFNPPEASCEEPLLPEYSAHPAEAFEIQVLDESATARKDSIIFDASRRNLTPVTEHKQQGGLREPQKNEYKLVPGEDPDLERG